MLFFNPKFYIVYSVEYFLGLCEKGPRSSFDCNKFRKVRDALLEEKLIKPRYMLEPKPCSWDDFKLVHTADYIESLKSPINLAKILFLDYVNPFDNDIMEFFMWVTGGTVLSLRQALDTGITTVNLGGGFHHGKRNKGEGFCPVNDIAVGIIKIRQDHPDLKVFIVDLDYHHGNGTATIFQGDLNTFNFSIHRDDWDDTDPENNMNIHLPDHTGDTEYLNALKRHLPNALQSFNPDLAIYIAGGDPHIDDTLGTFDITDQGMLNRDIFVTECIKDYNLPLAVVAGGGYGMKSWEIYMNYLRWLATGKSHV